VTHLSEDATLL